MDNLAHAAPLEVAIVGSGPSGFYAAEALLDARPAARITMYERLPVPFGLVRFGVAPDHPKLKSPALIFDRVAQHPNFRFIGNTTIGRDLSVEELREHHHATILAYGAEGDRNLDIPGETLPGSHTATEFVGWYNGHPDFRARHFDLSQESVAIIGQGNVAADLARILSMPADALATTDISSHALDALRCSRVRTIHVIGRRGPAQAKFTGQELRELGEIPGTRVRLRDRDLDLNAESLAELQEKKAFLAARNVELFRTWAAAPPGTCKRELIFHFLEGPVEIVGNTRVEGLVLERNRLEGPAFAQQAVPTGDRYLLPCGLIFRSIGYRGVGMAGLPFEARQGVLPNVAGRVREEIGVYTTGWIKRGPSGIIGTNRACALETISTLIKDYPETMLKRKSGAESTMRLLASRGVRVVSYSDWRIIDAAEVRIGQERGKPREKFTDIDAMLASLPSVAREFSD